MNQKSVVSIDDLSKDEIIKILDGAELILKTNDAPYKGKIMATLFFEPSTRTRLSFESAMIKLGGNVLGFSNPEATSFAKGESLSDAAKMIQNYCDLMVVRNPNEGSVKELADASEVPVINAGDGGNEHPSQTLIDLFSIRQCQGKLDGLNIAMVGDLKYGRTVHSLAKALSLFNSKLFFVSPDELKMPSSVIDMLKEKKTEFEDLVDIREIMDKIDVLYMTRIQKERFSDTAAYDRLKGIYILNKDSISNAKENMRIFHPLPRVDEISKDIDETIHEYYFKQARNAVPVRMALISHVLG